MDAQRFTSGYGSGMDLAIVFVYVALTAGVALGVFAAAVNGRLFAGVVFAGVFVALGVRFTVLLRQGIGRSRERWLSGG